LRELLPLRLRWFATNDERREPAFDSLTVARNEYIKALRAAAAARDKIFVHAHETAVGDLSQPENYKHRKIYATDFATEFFGFETTRNCSICTGFIGKNGFLRP
jgi:hypothetical protein